MSTRGLLFVYTERGDLIPSADFEEWYDSEHIPLRLTLPGPLFLSCTRWTAADGQKPTHLALYELASPDSILAAPYVALGTSRSVRELDVLAKLEFLDRRIYAPFALAAAPADTDDDADPSSRVPGPYLSVVEIALDGDVSEAEAELNRWYEEEHLAMLLQVPGWLRGRKYVIERELSVTGTSVDGTKTENRAPAKYITLHEWASLDAFETEEYKRASSTPWRAQVLASKGVGKVQRRVFQFFRAYGRGELL